MIKTASESFGLVLELVSQTKDASPEETARLIEEIYRRSEIVKKELESFDRNVARIRDENAELEIRIRKLNQVLDQKKEELSQLDMIDSVSACEMIYHDFWEKLDMYSRDYLAMANYLLKLFSEKELDYSLSVLEFGRAIENELVSKIYLGYVANLSENEIEIQDPANRYATLKKAVQNYTNNGECFIPARDMVKFLSYLSNEDAGNSYNDSLKQFLNENGIDVTLVSEKQFTDVADEVFKKYRNAAAHSGKTMSSDDAKACKEKSKKALKRFMNAIE